MIHVSYMACQLAYIPIRIDIEIGWKKKCEMNRKNFVNEGLFELIVLSKKNIKNSNNLFQEQTFFYVKKDNLELKF